MQPWNCSAAASILLSHGAVVLTLFGSLDDKPADFHSVRVPDEFDVLQVDRAAKLDDHPGQIAFPGGAVDAG